MDSTLPQMQSFDFDRLDPIALEDTLAYLRQHPEPTAEDIALCSSYQGLLDDAVAEKDWMAEPLQDMGGQSRTKILKNSPMQQENMYDQSQSLHTSLSHQGKCTKELWEPASCSSLASVSPSTPLLGGFGERSHPMSPSQMATRGSAMPLQQSRLAAKSKTFSGRHRCTWDGCQPNIYVDEEFNDHLRSHSLTALGQWTRGSRCAWQGCKSKAVFKGSGLFKEHLKNIHTNPLLCTKPRCSNKKPFKNKHELERHNTTIHSTERKWECPYENCSSETRSFARKDKWIKHIRETQHENDAFCPFYHCSLIPNGSFNGFESRQEIGKHFGSTHSGRPIDAYECAIGSCENTRNSDRWSAQGLAKHLQLQHKINMHVEHFFGATKLASIQFFKFYSQELRADWDICASHIQTSPSISTPTLPVSGVAGL